MTESYPETATSPTPAAPTLTTASVTDPAAEARPDHAKSRSNRRNALKSTGPRTVDGKARVSDNARSHGFLSRHLIVAGESPAEFAALLAELVADYQPVGVVETGLVEQVAIVLWRKARFVRAETAMVSLNRRTFGEVQAREVAARLGLPEAAWRTIPAPRLMVAGEDPELLADLEAGRATWQALVDNEVASGPEPFARFPAALQAQLLQVHGVEASGIEAVVIAEYGSWPALVDQHMRLFDQLLEQLHIRELSLLVMESQTLPTQTDLLGRYQTALDNDLYKALKALREAQSWRQAKAVLEASAVPAVEEGG
ncbi:MAG: hypothetical protein IT487_15155 [Chromatiaceae bacterium]|nr:hypothetical protein [Chromatiaceae bacterium]